MASGKSSCALRYYFVVICLCFECHSIVCGFAGANFCTILM